MMFIYSMSPLVYYVSYNLLPIYTKTTKQGWIQNFDFWHPQFDSNLGHILLI